MDQQFDHSRRERAHRILSSLACRMQRPPASAFETAAREPQPLAAWSQAVLPAGGRPPAPAASSAAPDLRP
jgi:hypothetical protein